MDQLRVDIVQQSGSEEKKEEKSRMQGRCVNHNPKRMIVNRKKEVVDPSRRCVSDIVRIVGHIQVLP